MTDTIFALSSGFGRAAIAVLRVSGPQVREILARMIGHVPEPRFAALRRFKDPQTGETLDRGLALFFEAPKSETGEDCAEFHCHGGPAVVAAMLRALASFPATRLAEPGEFARRAFENGKLDLTAVEGLADLIEAETEAQRRQALRQADGGLFRKAEEWRQALLEAAALTEAEIDFADEAEVAAEVAARARADVLGIVVGLAARLREELAQSAAGERLREGLTVVIAGPPNAGKSSLLNCLARREAAIVSALPGTTRDAIEVHLDLAGLPVTLIDTAGLRDSDDAIEAIGIARGKAKAQAADLVLWLSEAGDPQPPSLHAAATIWLVFTKRDLCAAPPAGLCLSAVTGENIDALVEALTAFAQSATARGSGALLTRARHRQALMRAVEALERISQADRAGAPELLAEDLRSALRALESLIGKVDVEMILGEIFSRFCIGK